MNAGTITAICTGVPAIIAAITALVTSLKSNKTVNDHVAKDHANVAPTGLPSNG